jgi:glutaredoxin
MFVIFGSTNCIHCRNAKNYLKDLNLYKKTNIKFKYIELNKKYPKKYSKLLEQSNEYNTIPKIFYNNKFIGGYSDMREFINNKNFLKKSLIKNNKNFLKKNFLKKSLIKNNKNFLKKNFLKKSLIKNN